MQTSLVVGRPAVAFAASVVGCCLYFAVLFAAFTYTLNAGSRISAATYLISMSIPIVLAGWFQAAITQRLQLSRRRRFIQIISAAVGAPVIAWYFVGFASVVVAGEGF